MKKIKIWIRNLSTSVAVPWPDDREEQEVWGSAATTKPETYSAAAFTRIDYHMTNSTVLAILVISATTLT